MSSFYQSSPPPNMCSYTHKFILLSHVWLRGHLIFTDEIPILLHWGIHRDGAFHPSWNGGQHKERKVKEGERGRHRLLERDGRGNSKAVGRRDEIRRQEAHVADRACTSAEWREAQSDTHFIQTLNPMLSPKPACERIQVPFLRFWNRLDVLNHLTPLKWGCGPVSERRMTNQSCVKAWHSTHTPFSISSSIIIVMVTFQDPVPYH